MPAPNFNYDLFDREYRQLNPRQKEAVDNTEGPVMVQAGPGTGKTQMLCLRIAHILRQTDAAPENILCITFTEIGARTMRQRLAQFIGAEPADKVKINTFHGFCKEIIDQHQRLLQQTDNLFSSFKADKDKSFFLPDDLDIHFIFKQLIDAHIQTYPVLLDTNEDIYKHNQQLLQQLFKLFDTEPVLFHPAAFQKAEEHLRDLRTLRQAAPSELSELKTQLLQHYPHDDGLFYKKKTAHNAAGDLKRKELDKEIHTLQKIIAARALHEAYKDLLKAQNLYTFDNMIDWVRQYLTQYPDSSLSYKLQESYQYILVDEFQDTNSAQWAILRQLTHHWKEEANIFVVGDIHQTIFGFQGAQSGHFHAFTQTYPNAKKIQLNQNYRSTQSILNSAHQLIQHNQTADTFSFEPLIATPSKPDAPPPAIACYYDSAHEFIGITEQIAEFQKKYPQKTIALLYRKRTHIVSAGDYGTTSFLLPHYLDKAAIAYDLHQSVNLLEDPLFRHLLQLLSWATQKHTEKNLLREILLQPYWDISPQILLPLLYAYPENIEEPLLTFLKKNTDHTPLQNLIRALLELQNIARIAGQNNNPFLLVQHIFDFLPLRHYLAKTDAGLKNHFQNIRGAFETLYLTHLEKRRECIDIKYFIEEIIAAYITEGIPVALTPAPAGIRWIHNLFSEYLLDLYLYAILPDSYTFTDLLQETLLHHPFHNAQESARNKQYLIALRKSFQNNAAPNPALLSEFPPLCAYLQKHPCPEDWEVAKNDWLRLSTSVQERTKLFIKTLINLHPTTLYPWLIRTRTANPEAASARKTVLLSTIHGVKGAEFDLVFLLQSNKEVWERNAMNHSATFIQQMRRYLSEERKKNYNAREQQQKQEQEQEKRRLFYVALTRAKEQVFISYAKYKNGKERTPCTYIQDLRPDYAEAPDPVNFAEQAPEQYAFYREENPDDTPPLSLPQTYIHPPGITRFIKDFQLNFSAFSQWAQCPISFYFTYILNLTYELQPQDNYLKRWIGISLHRILEKALSEHKTRPEDLQTFIQQEISQLQNHTPANARTEQSIQTLQHLKTPLAAYLQTHTPRFTRYTEKAVSRILTTDTLNIPLSGRIDYIEQDAQQNTFLTDYKSGRYKRAYFEAEDRWALPPYAPFFQSLFYYLLVDQVRHITFVYFSKNEEKPTKHTFLFPHTSYPSGEDSAYSLISAEEITRFKQMLEKYWQQLHRQDFSPGCHQCKWCALVRPPVVRDQSTLL